MFQTSIIEKVKTHSMKYLLHLHWNSGCTIAPQFCVTRGRVKWKP